MLIWSLYVFLLWTFNFLNKQRFFQSTLKNVAIDYNNNYCWEPLLLLYWFLETDYLRRGWLQEHPFTLDMEMRDRDFTDYLYQGLLFWLGLPIALCDLYRRYCELSLEFGKLELMYLDYWFNLPEAMHELLLELSLMGKPFSKGYFTDIFYSYYYANPPTGESEEFMQAPLYIESYSREDSIELIIKYFFREEFFKEIIGLWLLSNKKIESLTINIEYESCKEILNTLPDYILRFLMANIDLNQANHINSRRLGQKNYWLGLEDRGILYGERINIETPAEAYAYWDVFLKEAISPEDYSSLKEFLKANTNLYLEIINNKK